LFLPAGHRKGRSGVRHRAFNLLRALRDRDASFDEVTDAIHHFEFGTAEQQRAFDEENLNQLGQRGASAIQRCNSGELLRQLVFDAPVFASDTAPILTDATESDGAVGCEFEGTGKLRAFFLTENNCIELCIDFRSSRSAFRRATSEAASRAGSLEDGGMLPGTTLSAVRPCIGGAVTLRELLCSPALFDWLLSERSKRFRPVCERRQRS
jgi:hypothetical protein